MCDIGLVGLAVMGENLAMNMESKGFSVAVYNIETDAVTRFINGRGKGKRFTGTYSFKELAQKLQKPRIIMMMIRAGNPVDQTIDALIPLLDAGDILIDGGNSNYLDTIRRTAYVESKGMYFIGTGVSGGEEGALKGPVHHARRQQGSMAACQADFAGDLRKGRRRQPLL